MGEIERPWDAPKEPARPSTPGEQWLKRGGAVAGLLLVGWCSVETAQNMAEDTDGNEFGAIGVCEEFVKDRLKSPASANFSEESASTTGDGVGAVWNVSGVVDSQNSFGASVRTAYQCEVRYSGEENWRLIDLRTSATN